MSWLKNTFCYNRLFAIIAKEFIQMWRDHLTFATLIGIPLLQLVLFGYAINTNPKHLRTAVISADHSVFTRSLLHGMQNTKYFDLTYPSSTEAKANYLMKLGEISFTLNIPENFSRDLVRGNHPDILLTADASDPIAAGNAINAMQLLIHSIFNPDLQGSLSTRNATPPPVNLIVHSKYNPELITQYNIVPGLIGVILTMTMIIITAIAITREYETGTMENLLASPARPIEVLLGKVIPYILVGYLQILLILSMAYFLFHVPITGSLTLLCLCALPFIMANLSVGVTFSTIGKTQLQAVQMAFFFFLPSILLSGFMFPFYGMPRWAQYVGSILPLTYFLRIVRGIMLKGNTLATTWPNIWPIIVFMICALFIGAIRYRQTLD